MRKLRDQADALQRQAKAATVEVANDPLRGAHLTVRAAGPVLGLSHDRIA